MPTNETGILEPSVGVGFHACPRQSEKRNAKRAGTEACPYESFVRFMMATKRIRQARRTRRSSPARRGSVPTAWLHELQSTDILDLGGTFYIWRLNANVSVALFSFNSFAIPA